MQTEVFDYNLKHILICQQLNDFFQYRSADWTTVRSYINHSHYVSSMIFSLNFFQRSKNLDTWEAVCLKSLFVFYLFLMLKWLHKEIIQENFFLFSHLYSTPKIIHLSLQKTTIFLKTFFFFLVCKLLKWHNFKIMTTDLKSFRLQLN